MVLVAVGILCLRKLDQAPLWAKVHVWTVGFGMTVGAVALCLK